MLQNSVPPEMRSMLIAQSARMSIPQQQMGFPNGASQGTGFPMQNMFPGMNMAPEMMGMGMAPHMGSAFGPGNVPMAGAIATFSSGMEGSVAPIPNGMGGGIPGPSGMMQQQQQTLPSQHPQMQQLQQQAQGMPLAGELIPSSDALENNATPASEDVSSICMRRLSRLPRGCVQLKNLISGTWAQSTDFRYSNFLFRTFCPSNSAHRSCSAGAWHISGWDAWWASEAFWWWCPVRTDGPSW